VKTMTVTIMPVKKDRSIECPLSEPVSGLEWIKTILDEIRTCKHRLNFGVGCPKSIYDHPEVYERCYYYMISQPIKP